ncbi:MAG: site-specific DNA-methyltransferase [Clostridia bacterium]
MNSIIKGDCFEELKKIDDKSINMIYLDPPFFTQKKQVLSKKKENKIDTYNFEDNWEDINDYLEYMKIRLKECKRVLKDDGTIFLHCDRNACHYLKVLMDKIFGMHNFRSEIIWSYKRWSNSKKGLLNAHQNIFLYSKTEIFKFNTIYTDYSNTTNVDQILQNRKKDSNGITVYEKDDNGNIVNNYKKKGVPLSDVWEIPYLNPKAKERNGYPTQKPILLLEQIIKISTDQNDIILDPFCGSGTTLAAAKLLKRQYIGIDFSEEAIKLCINRLENDIIKTNSAVLQKGIEEYNQKSDYEEQLLKGIGAIIVQRNSGLDGILPAQNNNEVIGVKIQKENESLYEAINKLNKSCKTKNILNKILIKNENVNVSSFFESDIKNEPNLLVLDSYKDIMKAKIEKEYFKDM